MAIAEVLVDENHVFSDNEQWQMGEIRLFILNTESLYLHLVSLCDQAMGKINKGKYDEAQHLTTIVNRLVERAIKDYRAIDKTGSMNNRNGKVVSKAVRYRVALDLFNEVMEDLGYARRIEIMAKEELR